MDQVLEEYDNVLQDLDYEEKMYSYRVLHVLPLNFAMLRASAIIVIPTLVKLIIQLTTAKR